MYTVFHFSEHDPLNVSPHQGDSAALCFSWARIDATNWLSINLPVAKNPRKRRLGAVLFLFLFPSLLILLSSPADALSYNIQH
jgi:hypothetical protein